MASHPNKRLSGKIIDLDKSYSFFSLPPAIMRAFSLPLRPNRIWTSALPTIIYSKNSHFSYPPLVYSKYLLYLCSRKLFNTKNKYTMDEKDKLVIAQNWIHQLANGINQQQM